MIYASKSKYILINVPGYNGSQKGYKDKYVEIANNISSSGLAAVILLDNYVSVELHEYPQMIKNKLLSSIRFAERNSKVICGNETPKILLMGSSAGAAAIAAHAHKSNLVEKILLIAPSLNIHEYIILDGISKFNGEISLAVGLDDEITGVFVTDKIAKVKKIERYMKINKCDHVFSGDTNQKIFKALPEWAFFNKPIIQ